MGTHTIEFTCDSCKISTKIVMPYNMYFQFYPLYCYDILHILIPIEYIFSYHILFHGLCLYLVHIQWCTVYVIYIRYIYLRYIYYHKIVLYYMLYKLLILSSPKLYSTSSVLYVMKWVIMTYVHVVSHFLCIDVSSNFLNNRITNLELGQAFPDCC